MIKSIVRNKVGILEKASQKKKIFQQNRGTAISYIEIEHYIVIRFMKLVNL